jgi:hypothetical protein
MSDETAQNETVQNETTALREQFPQLGNVDSADSEQAYELFSGVLDQLHRQLDDIDVKSHNR